MKKWFLIISLVTILIITGCKKIPSQQNSDVIYKQDKNEDKFTKKIQCSGLDRDGDIKQNWGEMANDYTIDEIFYSPKKNTCVGIVSLHGKYEDLSYRDVWAYDILEKNRFMTKKLYGAGTCFVGTDEALHKICLSEAKAFDEAIRDLKSE